MISSKSILLNKLKNLLQKNRNYQEAIETTHNIQQQPRMALSYGQPAGKSLDEHAEPENKVEGEQSNTMANQLLGLGNPPSNHQLEILKHFRVKNRSEFTRTQASAMIKIIFSDPVNIEQWKQRPATSKIKQGILFMGGQLNSSMTQMEAQSMLRHYGKQHCQRFLEWKHIETLFLLVNSSENLEQYNARKLTWKCFFQVYDDLKNSGVYFNKINADKIHQHAKMIAFSKKPARCQVKTFAA
jgi:hypothetical protein